MFVEGSQELSFFLQTLLYGICRNGSKNYNIRACDHMILGQLRKGARHTIYAPLFLCSMDTLTQISSKTAKPHTCGKGINLLAPPPHRQGSRTHGDLEVEQTWRKIPTYLSTSTLDRIRNYLRSWLGYFGSAKHMSIFVSGQRKRNWR